MSIKGSYFFIKTEPTITQDGMYVDLKAAFNSVDHIALLQLDYPTISVFHTRLLAHSRHYVLT